MNDKISRETVERTFTFYRRQCVEYRKIVRLGQEVVNDLGGFDKFPILNHVWFMNDESGILRFMEDHGILAD